MLWGTEGHRGAERDAVGCSAAQRDAVGHRGTQRDAVGRSGSQWGTEAPLSLGAVGGTAAREEFGRGRPRGGDSGDPKGGYGDGGDPKGGYGDSGDPKGEIWG